MRKYYDDYEKGFEAGRREALRESIADFLSRKEVEKKYFKNI